MMITNLQALRAFAAVSVVLYHTSYDVVDGVHTDYQGVALFFVISGFLMTYITRDGDSRFFFLRRVVRIVPLYWLVTAFAYCWPYYSYHSPHRGSETVWDEAFLLESLFFFPYLGPAANLFPFLTVGWTLNLEMFCYLLVAVALRWGKRSAALLACLALVGIRTLDAATGHRVDLLRAYASGYGHYPAYFVCGVLVYYVWAYYEDIGRPFSRRGLLVTFVLVAASFLGLNAFGKYADAVHSLLACSSVVLISLLLHSAGVRVRWKPVLVLGDASYSLYLVHLPWLHTQYRLAAEWPLLGPRTLPGAATGLLVSCALAVALHYLVEKPLLRAFAAPLRRPGKHPPADPGTTTANT